MGKKSSRTSQTSKGERRNVSAWSVKAGRKDISELQRAVNQSRAFNLGKNVVLTIPNPNKGERDKPFIRVNAKEKWKNDKFIMKQTS
tara:strand:- start:289 stop:549 length:261 start_codon:yes stop_codon:yes gene_type:complete